MKLEYKHILMEVSIKMTDGEKSNATTVIIITLDTRPTAEGAITHTSVWNSVKTVSKCFREHKDYPPSKQQWQGKTPS